MHTHEREPADAPLPHVHADAPGASLDRRFLLGGLAGVAALAAMARPAAAGPLNPPAGPVASTPGPEPRIAVNDVNTPAGGSSRYRITQPGSYYLTGNILIANALSGGIEIAASDVTLDLCGFAIDGGAPTFGSLPAVNINGTVRRVTVRNGTIARWRGSGVGVSSSASTHIALSDLSIDSELGAAVSALGEAVNIRDCVISSTLSNGVQVGARGMISRCAVTSGSFAIVSSAGCLIADCTVRGANGGIFAVGSAAIIGCTVSQCGGKGISADEGSAVINCVSVQNTGTGIEVGVGCTVAGCTSRGNQGSGIVALDYNLLERNTVSTNGASGIVARVGNTIRGNHVSTHNAAGASGIHLTTASPGGNRLEENACQFNLRGYFIQSDRNILVRNTSMGNITHWQLGGGNYALILAAASNAGFTGNTGGSPIGPAGYDPSANFTL